MSLVTNIGDFATRVATEFKAVYSLVGALSGLATTDKSSIVAAINEVHDGLGGAGVEIDDVTPAGDKVYSSERTEERLGDKLDAADYTAADVLTKIKTVDGTTSGLDADLLDGNHATAFQAADADLSAIAALSADGIIRKTSGTYAMDATAYAPLASPALTGNPTAPTQTAGNNSTRVATTAYADAAAATAAAAVVASAPGTLDTLDELAAALGDDANFATSTATALGNRVRVDASQSFTSGEKVQARANIDVYSTGDIGDPTTNFVTTFEAGLV